MHGGFAKSLKSIPPSFQKESNLNDFGGATDLTWPSTPNMISLILNMISMILNMILNDLGMLWGTSGMLWGSVGKLGEAWT